MTTEQKAKAYDKVSKEVKDFFEGRQKMYSDVEQTLEYLFPELKENEDEKIRKWLIGYFHQYKEDGMEEYANGLKVESIIAWLEKQGFQRPTDEEMKEALRTEYEKGRADAIAEMQKPAWSEEDECYMSECIGAIATKDGWSFEEKRKTKHWLKSLKERCTWKPSDEQIKALHDLNLTGNISYAGQGQVLIELYNDLKKLAEE